MMPHQTCAGNTKRHLKIERPGEERTLGKSLLERVAAKVPRTKIGNNAKDKLKLLKW